MIFSEDDLLGLLEPFGVPVIAFAETGDQYEFKAIFNRGQKVFDEMLNVIAMDTNLVCRTNDVTSLDQTNPILVDNTSYKVRELTHDTVGITTIGIIKE
jgi:hypothetical protein